MPLSAEFPDGYGTEANGAKTEEYCKFCYQDGAFTKPDQTVDGMVESSIYFMTSEFKMPREEASRLSNDVIRKLSRWN